MAPAGSYAYWVRQATRMLSAAPFGQWWEDPTDPMSKDVFDTEFWFKNGDRFGGTMPVLEVKPGKKPSEAIDAILDRPSKWKHDCDHTVQIANLFAIRMVLGESGFNARITAIIPGMQRMQLRARGSDGLKTIAHFGRDTADQDWRVVTKYDALAVKADPNNPRKQLVGPFAFAMGPPLASKDERWNTVGAAPAGSRVRFTNNDAPLHAAFRHENCVKLAYDLYAAGGLSDPHVAWYELDEAGVAMRLAQVEKSNATPEYVRDHLFIDEVEVFDQG
jgi:hypothetical protein